MKNSKKIVIIYSVILLFQLVLVSLKLVGNINVPWMTLFIPTIASILTPLVAIDVYVICRSLYASIDTVYEDIEQVKEKINMQNVKAKELTNEEKIKELKRIRDEYNNVSEQEKIITKKKMI